MVGNDRVRPPGPVAVVGGCTGVGKTAVLHVLRARGEQIMDLEGLANHRGSAFGSMGMSHLTTASPPHLTRYFLYFERF